MEWVSKYLNKLLKVISNDVTFHLQSPVFNLLSIMQIIQVDAFTDKPFHGNPAAVCVLTHSADPSWMQNVAREMNLSETAFLQGREKEGEYDLRWFTPAAEVDLCGHATLASAHTLWEGGYVKPGEKICFYTKSGLLTAEKEDDWIILDFPAEPATEMAVLPQIVDAFQTVPVFAGQNRMDYLVELENAEAVRRLRPNMSILESLDVRGIIVTAQSDETSYDFISRFFAPRFGVPEDPVTGSAHCCLGPYWKQRLGKTDMIGYQASARGGLVLVNVGTSRVRLGGKAVTVLKAELIQ